MSALLDIVTTINGVGMKEGDETDTVDFWTEGSPLGMGTITVTRDEILVICQHFERRVRITITAIDDDGSTIDADGPEAT